MFRQIRLKKFDKKRHPKAAPNHLDFYIVDPNTGETVGEFNTSIGQFVHVLITAENERIETITDDVCVTGMSWLIYDEYDTPQWLYPYTSSDEFATKLCEIVKIHMQSATLENVHEHFSPHIEIHFTDDD